MFVGWDWAAYAHEVTVMDETGVIVDRWSLQHTEQGIGSTISRMSNHGQPGDMPVAIETSNGLVVDRLLGAGHQVVPIHPDAFNAARSRWGASHAKSDPGDSWDALGVQSPKFGHSGSSFGRFGCWLPVLDPQLPDSVVGGRQ